MLNAIRWSVIMMIAMVPFVLHFTIPNNDNILKYLFSSRSVMKETK